LESDQGHILSVLRGGGKIRLRAEKLWSLTLEAGVHLYIPPGTETILEARAGTELLHVSSASAEQARGEKLLLRNETFLSACASESQPLRWILTPQYLSRRIFLRHDETLLSKSGHPVSWFHTTMFDVDGLPGNEEGQPVFKMSYNSRTEVNFCYDVEGKARVRMARHPYRQKGQIWEPWLALDNDSTYHLNEAAGSREEECIVDEETKTRRTFRNKHEVSILKGYVSLFCLFDPAPTGIERHSPGEYSDYEPFDEVLKNKSYENYAREIAKYDEMVDQLSLAKATGNLGSFYGTSLWERYLSGEKAQQAFQTKLMKKLAQEKQGREHVLARFTHNTIMQNGAGNLVAERGRV